MIDQSTIDVAMKYVGKGQHTTLPGELQKNEVPTAPLPGVIIMVHGVNSIGEWYNECEQGLCDGLNDRLHRNEFAYGGDHALSPNIYLSDLTDDGKMDAQFSYKTFIQTAGNSPVIRFRWGYKADKQELEEYESQIWLDQKTKAWGGGPFQNGTSCLSDLWNDGLSDRLFAGVMAQDINPSSRPLYSAPPRNYYVHAADRLARLVKRIRQRHDGVPVTIVCHSQGNMVGLASALIRPKDGLDSVADTYILVSPPYSPVSNLTYDYSNGGFFQRGDEARLGTLRNFVERVKQRGAAAREKQTPDVINKKLGFERDGKTLFRLGDRQQQTEAGFIDRDNRGKVFFYCNPHDQLIGASPIQGIGWRGLTAKELGSIDPEGDTAFIRVWAQGVQVGEGDVNSRVVRRYHYWQDHWLTSENGGKYPDEWWYPKSQKVRYRVTHHVEQENWLFRFLSAPGKFLCWVALKAADVRVQADPDKSHEVPINAPALLRPVTPRTCRAGKSAGTYNDKPTIAHSRFDEGEDYGKAVREGDDGPDRRLTRYEDDATRRLYEAQARVDGAQPGSAKWEEVVTTRLKQMLNFAPENATDHGTIVANPEHSRYAMAWDVALGVSGLSPEQIHDLRKFADWRLGNNVDDEKKEAQDDAKYFYESTFNNMNLKQAYLADKRSTLAPGILDGEPGNGQKDAVYALDEDRLNMRQGRVA